MIKNNSLSAIDSMASLLLSKAQAKNTTDALITESAENLASCLNNVLKAGAEFASGNSERDQASDIHEILN